jgi:hypothetical protein
VNTAPRLPVTIVCATLNAFEAVRLTMQSLLRHTPPVERILVADNGSTDGTPEWLQTLPHVDVVSLEERRRQMAVERAWRRKVLARLERRGAAPASVERNLRHDAEPRPRQLTEHGATLDWLARQVATPYFVTLDSDVEFLADGWLEDMVGLMEQDGLAALGALEPGRPQYRARLAPHLLLVRTDAFRSVNGTFRGASEATDESESTRWREARSSWYLDFDDLAAFPTVVVYPPGAVLLDQLERAGHRWAPITADIAARYMHYGAMSWGGAADENGGAAAMRTDHDARAALVTRRLLAYEPA